MGARLIHAPHPERPPLRVKRRDVGHAPVGHCDLAQLLQPLVPRGLREIEDEPDLRRARATRLSEPSRVCTSRQPLPGRLGSMGI